MTGILNLQKNDILDLTKRNPTLNKLLVGAGWDVAPVKRGFFGLLGGADYDLDLMAYLLDQHGNLINRGHVYYGAKKTQGAFLHGDNLTGEGEGDDEKISIVLEDVPTSCYRIMLTVSIYGAQGRNQSFGQVQNAFVRLVDEQTNQELCRYDLTENGGDNTAVIMGELERNGSEWEFKAVGEYSKKSPDQIYKK